MNRYIFLQRIQWPVMLLTFGVTALLNEWNILDFGKSWPLYLIVLGVLKLAQRTALSNLEPAPYYPAQPQTVSTAPASSTQVTSIVPAETGNPGSDFSGGR